MKRSSILMFFALLCLFFTSSTHSQTINQKLITGIPTVNGIVEAYTLKYDPPTGGWVYAAYDTGSTRYTIISPKGTSKSFNYVISYNALFDSDGNSYVIASENITDTTFKYSILKNSDVIVTYDMIPDGWVIKNNVIYYAAQDAGKYYLVSYDTKAGTTSKSKAYDEIRLAYTPDGYIEGEPVGYVGFTKSGKIYYIARSGDVSFVVIDGEEQKHYSDIIWYDLKFNEQDEPCYIARSKGRFYEERGNTFIVKGNREFKSFDWVNGPIVFDNGGNPLYVGQDSAGEYIYRSTLMKGEEVIASVTGSIYNYMYTPSGNLVYVISTGTTSANGEFINKSSLVIDGIKGKEFTSVNNPVFGKGSQVLFIASDKDNKYFVVQNDEVISGKYDYISEAKYLPDGKIEYVGIKYGNYEKKIADKSFVVIDDETYGPYTMINTADWKTNSIVLTDTKGNYAFLAGELIDMTNYTYKYTVVTNKGESKAFDNISDLKYINNKLYYFAGNQTRKDSYIYNYTLYVNNKKLGDTYSAYTEVVVSNSGVMSFIASKGNEMYYVEVKP